eukprot:733767-Alexandrium_andersonii.AAC.1
MPACVLPENIFVVRPRGGTAILENPTAQAALKVERDQLRSKGTWCESAVEDRSNVCKREHA